jgi:hypothetical protein
MKDDGCNEWTFPLSDKLVNQEISLAQLERASLI